MNFLEKPASQIANGIKQESPLILTICSIGGLILTTVLAVKAKPKADILIEKRHKKVEKQENKVERFAKDALATLPVYGPAIISGGLTIACSVASYKINDERATTFAAAYTITEAKLTDYQKKVIETIGEKKEKQIRDEIAQDAVKKAKIPEEFDMLDQFDQPCYDMPSKRFFPSNREKINHAIECVNRRFREDKDDFVSWNDFRYLIGLPEIDNYVGDDNGFNYDQSEEISVRFSSVLNKRGEPCLAIDYDIEPRFDLRRML